MSSALIRTPLPLMRHGTTSSSIKSRTWRSRKGASTNFNETFEVIAANLISGVLVLLAPALFAHMRPGGIAILSGILFGQEDEVIKAMEQAGLTLREQYRDGKWLSLVMGRNNNV